MILKKYKSILLFLCCTLLFSCTGTNEVKIPSDILPKEKMAEVMVDIHLLEATMNLNIGVTDKIGINDKDLVVDVFKKHNITKAQYDESYLFYTRHPELLGDIYQQVLNELSKMQAEVVNSK